MDEINELDRIDDIDETLNMDEIEDMDISDNMAELNWNVGSVDEKYPTLQMDGMDYNIWIGSTIWLELNCWMKPDGIDEWKWWFE